MRGIPWNKIIFSVLILTLLIGLSSCNSDSKVVKDLKTTIDEFAKLPQRLVLALTNLMGGLRDIGGALAEQVRNIVQGMTEP